MAQTIAEAGTANAGTLQRRRPRPRKWRGGYFLRRIGFYLIAAWAAITFNFLLPRLMPGDPAESTITSLQAHRTLSAAEMDNIRHLFGASHEPLWSQYVQYLHDIFTANFGISLTYYPSPVSAVVGSGLIWTIGLVGLSTILAFVIGISLGIIAGWRRGTWFDNALAPFSTFLGSIPYFWLALLLILVFGLQLGWLPYGGAYDSTIPPGNFWSFIGSVISHGFLPAVTIIISSVGGWILGMRNMMITTISEDYVLMGKAKGLNLRRVMFHYAARNAILPSVSGLALSLGAVVGGSLLVEQVFGYPGVGNLLVKAISNLDYPLMQAIFLIVSLATLVANFIADSIYGLLDPRARDNG